MDRARTLLVNAVMLLSIFCFLQILPIDAEVQPFAAVLAAAVLALYATKLRLAITLYLVMLTIALAVSIVLYAIAGRPALGASIGTYLAVLAPVLVFGALLGETHRLSPAPFGFAILIWTFVGLSQMYFPGVQAALGLDSALASLISRYSDEALFEISRGATMLAPEPSYAAHVVFLFFAGAVYFLKTSQLSRSTAAIWLLAIAAMCIVNRSGTLIMLVTAYVGAYLMLDTLRTRSLYSAMRVVGTLAVCLLLIEFILRSQDELPRALTVLRTFVELVWEGEIDIVEFTMSFGSIRTISVLTAAHALFDGNLMGGGLGSWSYNFIDRLYALGVNPWELFFFLDKGALVDIKPYSHLGILAFDLGIVGVIMDLALLTSAFVVCGAHRNILTDPAASALVLVALLAIVANTLVSMPVYWVVLALALGLLSHRNPGASDGRHLASY